MLLGCQAVWTQADGSRQDATAWEGLPLAPHPEKGFSIRCTWLASGVSCRHAVTLGRDVPGGADRSWAPWMLLAHQQGGASTGSRGVAVRDRDCGPKEPEPQVFTGCPTWSWPRGAGQAQSRASVPSQHSMTPHVSLARPPGLRHTTAAPTSPGCGEGWARTGKTRYSWGRP